MVGKGSCDSQTKVHVSLKEELRAAIKAVYEGRHVSVCLPTGMATVRVCGTKLCFFVLTYKQARTSTVLLFCSHLQTG